VEKEDERRRTQPSCNRAMKYQNAIVGIMSMMIALLFEYGMEMEPSSRVVRAREISFYQRRKTQASKTIHSTSILSYSGLPLYTHTTPHRMGNILVFFK